MLMVIVMVLYNQSMTDGQGGRYILRTSGILPS